jgi:hypothetical protein
VINGNTAVSKTENRGSTPLIRAMIKLKTARQRLEKFMKKRKSKRITKYFYFAKKVKESNVAF